MPPPRSTSAFRVASALAEAHRAGIVHRDLKPDNVMIRPSGLVKLLDFGIARLSRPAETDVTSTTALAGQTFSGMVIGTPQYMSPEQARGLEVDQQTDLFSFGALLYELLSGTSPFAAATATDIIVAVLTREPPPLVRRTATPGRDRDAGPTEGPRATICDGGGVAARPHPGQTGAGRGDPPATPTAAQPAGHRHAARDRGRNSHAARE